MDNLRWISAKTTVITGCSNLFERFQIEIPVIAWGNAARLIRISVQLYNLPIDYQVLAEALSLLHTEAQTKQA